MREPGGVGTMDWTVRAPGPDKDYLNTWTKKHIPGLNIEGPSMSIMGSETAQFGFGSGQDGAAAGLVDNPFQGGDVLATNQNGTPLDRAAAAVETWFRGALAKRPSTPMTGHNRSSSHQHHAASEFGGDAAGGDLIELADTSDDGRSFNNNSNTNTTTDMGLTRINSFLSLATGGRDHDDSGGQLRGRSGLKGGKAD